jgi:hydrogenase nickel incorporation protein HypA/HybF
VVREALLFSFDLAAAGTVIEGARLEIEEVPVAVFCPACGEERTLPGIQSFLCPVCGAPTPDVVRGRELELATMEVSTREAGRNVTPDR